MAVSPDAALLARLKDPDSQNEAFRELIAKHQQKVYWHVRRMVICHEDADDLVQNIFIKVFQHIDSFRAESSIYTWIYRITVNEVFTHLKSLKKNVFVPFSSVSRALENTLVSDPYFKADDVQQRFQRAILKLPPKQRLVFNMKYHDETLTFDALSEILDTSAGALKASYHHAVKKIEKELTGD